MPIARVFSLNVAYQTSVAHLVKGAAVARADGSKSAKANAMSKDLPWALGTTAAAAFRRS
eukprot:8755058-Karenia_brevis.AAC.1